MSTQDAHDDYESSSTNIDAKLDRYKDNNAKAKSSSKSKDVSHVPCKFFKVGSCTAGSSCPFSHQVQQPGQQKDVCAWFVKGNCKFGHKCALAHILPGQSPAMDRRNKKAAQLATAAAGNTSSSGNNSSTGGTGGAVPKDRDRDRERTGDSRNNRKPTSTSTHSSGRGGSSSRSNTLLSGSTAPTRMLSAGARPPLPISISKAAPAPAETAPALRDADFTSRDTPIPRGDDRAQNGADVQQQHPSREGDTRKENVDNSSINPSATVTPAYGNGVDAGVGLSSPPPKPATASPFPVSTPPRPHRFTARHGSSPSIDFGPVGSPPRASPSTHSHHHHHHHHDSAANSSSPIRINGFSPGTSPRDPVQGTQPLAAPTADPPFSAPGANLFASPSNPRGNVGGSGLLAASLSLGTAAATAQSPPHMQTQPFAVGSLPVLSRPIAESTSYAEALDDEDMEDFVPSSLKDLLTPEEQSRRMSRTSSSRTGVLGIGGTGGEGTGGAGGIPTAVQRSGVQREDTRHRHSRSVPGASLLSQDLRSIWSDTPGGQDPNPGFGGLSPPTGIGVLGTSPSFSSSPGLHAFDKDGPSPSMLSPSNASAAFLGLHHYMSGAGGHPSRVPGGISAVRAVSQGNIHHQTGLSTTGNAGLNVLPSASSSFDARAHSHLHAHVHGLSSSPSHSHTQFANRPAGTSAFNAFSSSPSQYTTSLSAHHVSGTTQGVAAFRSGGAGTGVPEQALSPASRALQAHIPGQSLPQGLAAGFSRIHLQPAAGSPGAAFSPGSASISGSFFGNSNGTGTDASGMGTNGGTGAEWLGSTPTNQTSALGNGTLSAVNNATAASEQSQSSASNVPPASNANTPDQQLQPPRTQVPTTADVGGLTSMFSHLSYSSVAAGGLRGHSPNSIPTSVSRRGSGRGVGGVGAGPGGWGGPGVGGGSAGVHPHPLSSPLSGPVLTNDDDDLFSMDEEK